MSAQPVDILDAGDATGTEEVRNAADQPALPRLRLVPAPQLEPDPDGPRGRVALHPVAHHVLLRAPHTRPDAGPAGRPVPLGGGVAAEVAQLTARRPTGGAHLPEPTRWAHQFVQAAVEVAVALRPAVQLVRWTDDDVYRMLVRRSDIAAGARRTGRLATPPGRTRVRSARAHRVGDGVVEASAVVSDGTRSRCVALRMEGLDGRWRVTALELG